MCQCKHIPFEQVSGYIGFVEYQASVTKEYRDAQNDADGNYQVRNDYQDMFAGDTRLKIQYDRF